MSRDSSGDTLDDATRSEDEGADGLSGEQSIVSPLADFVFLFFVTITGALSLIVLF